MLSTGNAGSNAALSQAQTVRDMIELEQREKVRMTFNDHLAEVMTMFSGSMIFVWLHGLWFLFWIMLNLLGFISFDPFPFGLLTMLVSLESIFLSTFVLISQNRQALLSDKRAKLDLQVNVIAEQEVTKLLRMVEEIQSHLGIRPGPDPEVREMEKPTHIRELADKMEAVEAEADKDAAAGPASAADTEA